MVARQAPGDNFIYAFLPKPQQIIERAVSMVDPAPAVDRCVRCQTIADRLSAQGNVSVDVEIKNPTVGLPHLGMDEAYELRLSDGMIYICADSTWGGLRGLATAAQIVEGSIVADLEIQDHPRFAWRGVLIDVARHFVSLKGLYHVLDGMFLLKLNVLHLHLTDDQAVRLKSEKYPRLASPEAYALTDLQALVSYAADRGIRVVPELDLPGHMTHWIAAYPELAPEGFAVEPTKRFGVHPACLDPTGDHVYKFLGEIFAEVVGVFGDEYVHLGGDEVHPKWWSESESVRKFMVDQGFDSVADLQNYFMCRVQQQLQSRDRKVVAWDEVLHPDLPPLLVQNWRGATTRDRALSAGHGCIVSAGYYLDLFYPAHYHYRYDPGLPQDDLIALEDSWQQDLQMDHVAEGVEWTKQWRRDAEDALANPEVGVLGGEACLWAELVDEATLPTRLWSRLPAIAERLWSAVEVLDVEDFYGRLEVILEAYPFELTRRQTQALMEFGLTESQREIAQLFEPVKWYARLLGEAALAARLQGSEMPQARPYDTQTPLNRIVDFISPESLTARRLVSASDENLAIQAQRWRALEVEAWPQDIQAAIASLKVIGEQLVGFYSGAVALEDVRAELQAAYQPQGEYMVAVIPGLLARYEQSGS
ncbi:MAG: family 20 glycosylhydrolase [Pseudomonadota bacterium]